MDNLSHRNLQSVHRVISEALAEIKLSRFWLYLHNEHGIGRKNGNNLQLSKEDRQRIREITQNSTRIDPMQPLPSGSRLEISKYSGNEKLGSDAPGRHHLLLNSPNGLLKINTVEIPLSLGSSYRCDWRELDVSQVENVIVVENLQAFDYIQQAQLPKELQNAWVLYRGHDVSSQAVRDLLNRLPKQTQIIGFADYDPDGFKILLTNFPRISHCLLPELGETLFNLSLGTQLRFQIQQAAIDYIENVGLPASLHPHWQALIQHRVCISQEQIMAQSINLSCYPIF